MDWSLLAIPFAGLLRSVGGWLENGLKDGVIDSFEVKELTATVVKYLVLGFGFYFGLDLNPATAAGATILTDFGISTVKKIGAG